MKTLRRVLVVTIASGALVLGAGSVLRARAKLRVHITTGRMNVLCRELRGLQPKDLAPETLRKLLAEANCPECMNDAWGHPLLVERIETSDGGSDFRVTSLGSDGQLGPCCEKWVRDTASDAVLLNDDWLQVWSIPNWP